jgi:GR25 family glycosyltransferase involved in LPS biosynthesis
MKSGDGKNVMVLEDDVIFCSDFRKRLDYINKWADGKDWDIIWLGGTFHVPAFWHKKGGSGMPPNCSLELGYDCRSTDDERMIRTFGSFSTYAYIVNHKSIDRVLDVLESVKHRTIGIDYSFIATGDKLNTFAFVPGCCKQMDNLSDIGSGMTVFSGFSKLNGTEENSRYWWQDKMEDFDPKTFNFND